VATALSNGLVRLWGAPEANQFVRHFPAVFPAVCSSSIISPDGQYVLPLPPAPPQHAQVHELATGKPAGKPLPLQSSIFSASFSPDGSQLTLVEWRWPIAKDPVTRGWVSAWDWRDGRRVFGPVTLPERPSTCAYRPDGRQLVILGHEDWILVLDAATGKIEHKLEHKANPGMIFRSQRRLLYARDGQTFVTAGIGNNAWVWDSNTGKMRYPPLQHQQGCVDLDLSPDGRWLLTASYDKTARLWDLAAASPRGQPLQHPDWIYQARFSPDGRYVLTACRDHMARVWDLEAKQLACPPLEHRNDVFSAIFSRDQRWIFTCSGDRQLRAWEFPGGKPVTPAKPLDFLGGSLDITPNGRFLIVEGDKNFEIHDLADLADPGLASLSPDDLCLWGELVSGQRLVEGGSATNLTGAEWFQRWQRFRAAHPDAPGFPGRR
jgi:WD40 repeat protein